MRYVDSVKNEVEELLDLVENLKTINEHSQYHPEENVYLHSIQVFTLAFNNSNSVDLILAALLHDIGKARGYKKHPSVAVEILSKFSIITPKVLWLIENHRRIEFLQSGTMKKQSKINALKNNPYYPDLEKLRKFDIEGRKTDVKVIWNRESIKEAIISLINKSRNNSGLSTV